MLCWWSEEVGIRLYRWCSFWRSWEFLSNSIQFEIKLCNVKADTSMIRKWKQKIAKWLLPSNFAIFHFHPNILRPSAPISFHFSLLLFCSTTLRVLHCVESKNVGNIFIVIEMFLPFSQVMDTAEIELKKGARNRRTRQMDNGTIKSNFICDDSTRNRKEISFDMSKWSSESAGSWREGIVKVDMKSTSCRRYPNVIKATLVEQCVW